MEFRFALIFLLFDIACASLFQHSSRHVQRLSKRLIQSELLRRDVDPEKIYPEHFLSVPVDHFHNDSKYEPHSSGMFKLRYWFDDTFYKEGGPVIVLGSGETDGTGRLPYLQKGIVYQLSKATGGIGVILEHRYYGKSFPTPNLSVENMRFCTTDQALADTAYFAQNLVFPGHEGADLTSETTPWIAYGGSYAGAFVAILRKLYPDVFWGAISSSGVTKAIWDYWEYYEPVRKYGPPTCISRFQYMLNVADTLVSNNSALIPQLKSAFGLSGITHNDDFTTILNLGLQYWQSRNWDPAVGDPTFFQFCRNVTSDTLIYPAEKPQTAVAQKFLRAAGYDDQVSTLTTPMLNFFGFSKAFIAGGCEAEGETLDQCYSTYNRTYYAQDDYDQSEWRSWAYQYCTEWGFLQTGSGVPANQLPLISRLTTLKYTSNVCRFAFNISAPPNTAIVNKHGGFRISYPRLAIVDGEIDPWRPATPHAPAARPWNRPNTASEPFLLIPGAVHHWDENGLFPNQTTASLPPHQVADAQSLMSQFVQEWMLEAQLHFKKK